MSTRRYRHRVDIADTVSLDIVTERSELPAAQVEALLAAHLNFDEGNALDYGVLDGHMPRLYLHSRSTVTLSASTEICASVTAFSITSRNHSSGPRHGR